MHEPDDMVDEPIEELANQAALASRQTTSIYSGQRALKIVTNNDIVRYLQARFTLAEAGTIHWPPIMRLVFKKANEDNKKLTELLIGTLELLLAVPIQVRLVYGTQSEHSAIDLNDPETFVPYNGGLFMEAICYTRQLLAEGFLSTADIRSTARYLFITR